MEENQLRILEERINNAISFIENLKSKEKALVEEKERLQLKKAELEEVVRDKNLKIEALQENQLFLKNKIEAILDKLEALAEMEGYENAGLEKSQTEAANNGVQNEEQETADIEEESGQDKQQDTEEIIIEENLVDLKNDSEEQPQTGMDDPAVETDEKETDAQEEEEIAGETASESEKTLFNEEEDIKSDNQLEEGPNGRLSSDYNNPFIES